MTKTKKQSPATKQDIDNLYKKIKGKFATKDDLKNELKRYVTKDDLSDLEERFDPTLTNFKSDILDAVDWGDGRT